MPRRFRCAVVVCAILALSLAVQAAETCRASRWVSYVLVPASASAGFADATTTVSALARNAALEEANPLLRRSTSRPLTFGLLKGATEGGVNVAAYRLASSCHPYERRLGVALLIGNAIGKTWLAVRNDRLERGGAR